MNKVQFDKINKMLNDINIDLYELDGEMKDIKDIDALEDHIQEQGLFDVEIIYYYKAMEYLMENDQSLRDSLEIASEYGLEVDSLNSETLASLLASQRIREEFSDIRDEIEEVIEN